MDNYLESHKWNHVPREWGEGCLQEQLLLLIDDGVYPPTVLKACIIAIFLYEGLLYESNKVYLSYEFPEEIDEYDDIHEFYDWHLWDPSDLGNRNIYIRVA